MIKNFNVLVKAGEATKISTLQGNYIRCIDSQNTVLKLRLMDEKQKVADSEFEFEKGLGFETRPFYGMHIRNTSANDVLCKLVVSDEGVVNDNRTSGSLSIGAAQKISYINPVITTSDTVNGVQALPFNQYRKSATIGVDVDCFINNVGGIVLKAGTVFQWENAQELILIPISNPLTITGFDETN